MKVCSVREMQSLDERTIHELGIPSLVLMERAALGVVAATAQHFGDRLNNVHILAGTGNNGGDALAVARILHNQSIPVHVWLHGADSKRTADNRHQLELVRKLNIPMLTIEGSHFASHITGASLLIDGILGIGLSRPMVGLWASVIELVNALHVPVVAIDIPSGLDGDTGQVHGVALRASLTVACGLLKQGLLMDPALDWTGRTESVDIGIPFHYTLELPGHLLDEDLAASLLPQARPRSAHKGNFGHLVILAGSQGMSGAAVMAAKAALRSGVGLLHVLVPASIQAQVAMQVPEAMVVPLPDHDGHLTLDALPMVQGQAENASALLIGPGLGPERATGQLVRACIAAIPRPMVIDADGLNHFAQEPMPLPHGCLLTPHAGEMARLLSASARELQNRRVEAVGQAARQFGCPVIFKGANSLIADPQGNFWVNTTGNPGLARGGSGDVLAGLSAGLLAQGRPPLQAALLGTYWHGLAGDALAKRENDVTMSVGELISELPHAYSQMLKSRNA
jgi:hydroxyethylthiazole kinase-like uncharacterized protein yjeF